MPKYITLQIEEDLFYSMKENMDNAAKLIETTTLLHHQMALVTGAVDTGAPMEIVNGVIHIDGLDIVTLASYHKAFEEAIDDK